MQSSPSSRFLLPWLLFATFLWHQNTVAVAQAEHRRRGQEPHQSTSHPHNFYVGTGISDVTGPAAQINFMGYAKSGQTGHGIHLRLRSRAFIISETVREKEATIQETTIQSRQQSLRQQRQREDDQDLPSSGDTSLFSRFLNFFLPRTYQRIDERTAEQPGNHQSTIDNLDPNRTICFVSVDIGMGSDMLTKYVVQRLEELLPQQQQSSNYRLCHLDNLSISGTHTHSANAGFLQYVLYQITSKGFAREEVFDTYVESIAQSIFQAYRNLQPANIALSKSELLQDANINRSPTSYLLNPEWERDMYKEEGDTDKTMTQLTFLRVPENGYVENDTDHDNSTRNTAQTPIGVLNWFAVHGTSMNGTNTLISGDNKGYASYMMERQYNIGNNMRSMQSNTQQSPSHCSPFIAAFASTNLGDVSPNTAGPRCLDTGGPCDADSTCRGKNELCVAFGPGKDMQESAEIIGLKQYEASQKLLKTSLSMKMELSNDERTSPRQQKYLSGPIAFRHAFVNMANRTVVLNDNTTIRTCPAALGYGFAAGTTDGPGMFDFSQGQNSTNVFWNIIGKFLSVPSKAQIDCHAPKPILLNTGEATLPYAWDPKSVPISVFRIGNFYLLNVPAELTTMAGRRLRRAIEDLIEKHYDYDANGSGRKPQVTIAGLANSYTHYVTTFEEYAGQRYEAASTLYGPYTLAAYIQEFERLTSDLLNSAPSTSDNPPEDLLKRQLSLITPAMSDTIGFRKKFGSVANEIEKDTYKEGETVYVSFRSANPRHNQRLGGTFLSVDRMVGDDKESEQWQTLYVDGDWCTKYIWKAPQMEPGISFAEIYWNIPKDAPSGTYRICHYGTRKTWLGAYIEGWSLRYVPDWVYLNNLLGSMAAGWMWRLLHMLEEVVEPVRDTVATILEMGRLKDFEGCSKTFQLKR